MKINIAKTIFIFMIGFIIGAGIVIYKTETLLEYNIEKIQLEIEILTLELEK